MSIGIWQVVLILMIVLIIFGAGKLPRVMGDVAKGIKSFKSGMKDDEDETPAEAPRVVHTHAAPPATPTAAHPVPTGSTTVDHTTTVKKDETAKT
ncbi:MAG TPA: twin-arginine translocase TatA/TatE family subunit [Skermanella sp.]|jgi:sec-independent protein translocase protein TatA|nr:twin-arginine translocase TatA/TatE family subunit [Skermanella sp.]